MHHWIPRQQGGERGNIFGYLPGASSCTITTKIASRILDQGEMMKHVHIVIKVGNEGIETKDDNPTLDQVAMFFHKMILIVQSEMVGI